MSYSIKKNYIKQKRVSERYSYRQLVKMTKEADPEGKGISTMTCIRSEQNLEGMTIKTFLLLCNVLDVSPRNFFTNKQGR